MPDGNYKDPNGVPSRGQFAGEIDRSRDWAGNRDGTMRNKVAENAREREARGI